jgi:hypothetical protein
VSHLDPDVLAPRVLGENVRTAADEAHLSGCASCQAELDQLIHVVGIARRAGHMDQLQAPPAEVWDRITQELEPGHEPGHPATRPMPRLGGTQLARLPVSGEPAGGSGALRSGWRAC